MSAWSNNGNATLGEIIDHLAALPPEMVVEQGFKHPHSYRGYYEDLAFEPDGPMTVRAMLAVASGAEGETFTGYKGGDFTMTRGTDCWLASYGDTGVPIVLPGQAQSYYELPVAIAEQSVSR